MAVNAPDNARHTQEPDQYGQINMYDERGVEQVYPGKDILNIGRTGQNDTNGRQPAHHQHTQGT